MTVEERLAKLEKFIGVSFLEGPQLSQMNATEFAQLTVPANELPNGEYNFALYQALTNRILADQASVIATQAEDIRKLKLAGSGSVTPAPQPTPPPIDIQALALALQPFFNDGTLSVGNVPGFGVGVVMRTTGGHCVTMFTTDFDRAFRILPNLDPDHPERDFTADPDLTNPRLEFEQNGMWSMSMQKPFNTPPGLYDYEPTKAPMGRGKHLVFRVGGNEANGQVGPNCQVYSGLLQRHLVFGVSRTHPNVLDAVSVPGGGEVYGDFHIDGNDPVNPIRFTVNGIHRKLVVKNVGGTEVLAPE